MSPKELKRAEVLSRVKEGTLTLGQAATRLGVSYRQLADRASPGESIPGRISSTLGITG